MASELIGVAELHAKLRELGSPAENARVLRSALLPPMNRVKSLARANLSAISPGKKQLHKTYKGRLVSAGFASRSLRVKTFVSRDKTRISALLGVVKEAYYAVTYFELGTSRIPRQPWLVPAFEASKSISLSVLVITLRKRIEKVAKKKGTVK